MARIVICRALGTRVLARSFVPPGALPSPPQPRLGGAQVGRPHGASARAAARAGERLILPARRRASGRPRGADTRREAPLFTHSSSTSGRRALPL